MLCKSDYMLSRHVGRGAGACSEMGAVMDKIGEERRRLSAAWLNIVAAGLVSAGAVHSLAWVAAEGWGERAARLLALGAGYVLVGFGCHLFARALIPSAPAHGPSQGGPVSEQNKNIRL